MASTIEDRLHRLEATEAIRDLKARYLAACDAKDPEGVRACFADGGIEIDYGPIGSFDNADDLVAIYRKMACHPHMVEMHHGSNPRIEVLDTDTARGRWSMQYQLINTREMTLTQLGGEYDDEYRFTPDGWRIGATRFQVSSTLVLELSEEVIKCLVAGRKAPVWQRAG